MAENTSGLRPMNSGGRNDARRRSGRAQVNRSEVARTGLTPAAAPTQSYVRAQANHQDNNTARLAKALGQMNPRLSSLADTFQQKHDDEVMNSAEVHIQRIREEVGSGTVKQVQVGELLPEASATVTAKITQAMGKRRAKEIFQPYMEEIEQNDNLRLDSEARAKYLAEAQKEIEEETDDPFFTNGAMEGFRAQVNQHETRWAMETAKYQKEAVAEEYTEEISNMVMAGATKGDWKDWDSTAANTGPFTNQQRNALVVETVKNVAFEQRDPSMLEQIPDRFLNAEAKRDLVATRQSIQQATYTEWSHNLRRQEEKRKTDYRKNQMSIIDEYLETGTVDISEWRQTPEAFAYAQKLMTSAEPDKVLSAKNSRRIRSGIVESAMTGDAAGLRDLGFEGEVTEDNMLNFLTENQNLTVKDARSLIDEVPDLMEGGAVLEDPQVSSAISNVLRPQIKALRESTNQDLQQSLQGVSLESEVMMAYEDEVMGLFMAEYEDEGAWPKGTRKRELVKQARDHALDVMKNLSGVGDIGKSTSQAQEEARGQETIRVQKDENGNYVDQNGNPL